jgi:hypothetical protein
MAATAARNRIPPSGLPDVAGDNTGRTRASGALRLGAHMGGGMIRYGRA